MNTTEHYQLSQWEGSDRILREDFNADNRKTEEALAELAGAVEQKAEQTALDTVAAANCLVKLKSVTLGAVNSYSLNVADVDWSQYRYVLLVMNVEGSNGTVLRMRFNGQSGKIYNSDGSYWDYISLLGRGNSGYAWAVLTRTLPSGTLMGHTNFIGLEGNFYGGSPAKFQVPSMTLDQIRSIDVYETYSQILTSGGEVALYGLKR